jgi:hypothetical protein
MSDLSRIFFSDSEKKLQKILAQKLHKYGKKKNQNFCLENNRH